MPIKLIRTKTGGYSLVSLIFALAGAASILFQLLALISPRQEETSTIALILPGIMGVLLLLLFFFTTRNGLLEIFSDKIQGKTAAGKSFQFSLDEVAEIELDRSTLLLRDESGKIILSDKTPRFRKSAGLIWLLKQNPEIPEKAWARFPHIQIGPGQAPIRLFLDENENPVFGDRGFFFKNEESIYFFPHSSTSLVPKATQQNLSEPILLKFDPPPEKIPLEKLIYCLMEEEILDAKLLAELSEKHGGTLLHPINTNKENEECFLGKTRGWKVKIVFRPRQE